LVEGVTKKIGVLALQGDFEAHAAALRRTGVEPVTVKTSEALRSVEGLIVPGGESTTFFKLAREFGLVETLVQFANQGSPILGTCAGLILLAKQIQNPDQESLGLIDIVTYRNGYGSQKESFEAQARIPVLGRKPFPLVFIRAPVIVELGERVEPLAEYGGKTILARQGNILVATFHPELTEDSRLHEYFVRMDSSSSDLGTECTTLEV
jgi:5'-phosphate synthase pdxT subunit